MLAYFDSFAGLVPCKVAAAGRWDDYSALVTVKLTATRGAYKRGEVLCVPLRHVVPRTAIRYRCGIARIARFSWPDIVAAHARATGCASHHHAM